MTWLIVAGVVAVLAIFFVATYNKLVGLKQLVDEAFSTIDVYLKKRYDLIPNLVETVKGYAAHEAETFEQVVRARNSAMNTSAADDVQQKIEKEGLFEQAIRRMMLVVEQYPNLKADSQFLDLQHQLGNVETDLSQARKYYNGSVRTYNTTISKIPTNLVAGMFGYKERPYFEVADDSERQNVKVSF